MGTFIGTVVLFGVLAGIVVGREYIRRRARESREARAQLNRES